MIIPDLHIKTTGKYSCLIHAEIIATTLFWTIVIAIISMPFIFMYLFDNQKPTITQYGICEKHFKRALIFTSTHYYYKDKDGNIKEASEYEEDSIPINMQCKVN